MAGNGIAPRPAEQAPQELLAWLLRNGRQQKLCNEVARISGAPHGLVEDAPQDVCLLAATTRKCRGRSEGEVYNWLKRATLRRVRRLLERAHLRYEVLVDWSAVESELAPAGEGADVKLIERERQREQAELARTVLASLNERELKNAAGGGNGGGGFAALTRYLDRLASYLIPVGGAGAVLGLIAGGFMFMAGNPGAQKVLGYVALGVAHPRAAAQDAGR